MRLILSIEKRDLGLGALQGGEAHIPRRCLEALAPEERSLLEANLREVQQKLHLLVLASEREALREDFAAITAMAQRLGERLAHPALGSEKVRSMLSEVAPVSLNALRTLSEAMKRRGHWR